MIGNLICERLEEEMGEKNVECLVSISDLGTKLLHTTQFGECDFILTRDNIRQVFIRIFCNLPIVTHVSIMQN